LGKIAIYSDMTITSRLLASGRGWTAHDVVCTAGPADRPFEERHDWVCIAAVTHGTFQYRTSTGAATLAPGALLLGNPGEWFECGHEHGAGDRCLSFHFAPDYFEEVVAATPRARLPFAVSRLAPAVSLLPLIAAAESARDDAIELEEHAWWLAGSVAAGLARAPAGPKTASRRDERRVSHAVRRLTAAPQEPVTLVALARDAAMSPFHFLRTFRSVVGITPHQYLLLQRLRRAAVRLRQSDEPVSTIAYDSGFNDLATFNRRFRRIMGMTPSAYRRERHKDSEFGGHRQPPEQHARARGSCR
jgi:AraC family transcriptional regulator